MREFKKPDLNAPRYRPGVHSIMNKEFFESFKKKYPKYKDLENIELRKIVKHFNKILYQTVIDTRDGVLLPEQIGWLFIGTCQSPKKENIDFAKSNKYGVAVSNKNWETDGKLAKRSVEKTYPENWNMYVVVNPTEKLKLTYNKHVFNHVLKEKQKKDLEHYNEFNL
jgi:hypothetical protein